MGSHEDKRRGRPDFRPWTKDDIRYLRLNAAILPPDRMAADLGRTLGALRVVATKKHIKLRRLDSGEDALSAERQARVIQRPMPPK